MGMAHMAEVAIKQWMFSEFDTSSHPVATIWGWEKIPTNKDRWSLKLSRISKIPNKWCEEASCRDIVTYTNFSYKSTNLINKLMRWECQNTLIGNISSSVLINKSLTLVLLSPFYRLKGLGSLAQSHHLVSGQVCITARSDWCHGTNSQLLSCVALKDNLPE